MTTPTEVTELVRGFPNNSFRYLMKEGENVGDLLKWKKPNIAAGMDFANLKVEPDTFVSPGFRELETDVLVSTPWLGGSKDQQVFVYTLVEHQTEPDNHAIFRSGRYSMQVYDKQEKAWLKDHDDTRQLKFNPVLPVVLYSGTRTWDAPKEMAELVKLSDLFGDLIPNFSVVFVNVDQTDENVLRKEVGILGWILWLIQQKRAKAKTFEEVLQDVLTQLDPLSQNNPSRWRHTLWFTHVLVYHARQPDQREHFAEVIRNNVRSANKPEVSTMSQTIADALIEEGRSEGRSEGVLLEKRETVKKMVKFKLKKVPAKIAKKIDAAEIKQLAEWFDALLAIEDPSLVDAVFAKKP